MFLQVSTLTVYDAGVVFFIFVAATCTEIGQFVRSWWWTTLHLLPTLFCLVRQSQVPNISSQGTNFCTQQLRSETQIIASLPHIKLYLAFWSGESNAGSHPVTHASHYRAGVSVSAWWLLVISFREARISCRLRGITVLIISFFQCIPFTHACSLSEHLNLTRAVRTTTGLRLSVDSRIFWFAQKYNGCKFKKRQELGEKLFCWLAIVIVFRESTWTWWKIQRMWRRSMLLKTLTSGFSSTLR